MLTKLTRGNQITIPKPIIEKAHLKAGDDYLDVEYREGVIYLKPVEVEERIAPEIFEKFQKQMLKKERDDILVDEKEAEGFLSKRTKKKR
ncbi:MAG: AbrB/MazE/SpoVT family DNA-binding domain-containing protein [Thermodesulfovibrionia bacterium]|nr:AbrB/MazE/SpoVT family DNA-binding domain-containing protein [Thermodesulfovibrionia bacterium]